jgi:sterol desaturase/sphingolipid hydroxylase (fatty acid hydroxylase superfamily)
MGIGWVYVGYTIVKLSVIIGAHSAVAWDRLLLDRPALHPLLWLLQRTISTPVTHRAHHALTQDDGIGHYTGNYGNLLFIWDVLFGTAHITRRYPPAYGLPDDLRHGPERWAIQFLFPILRSHRAETVLGHGAHTPPAAPVSPSKHPGDHP